MLVRTVYLFQLFRRSAAALPGMDSRDKPETGEGFLFSNFNKLPCFVCVSDMSVYEQEVALLYLIKKIYTSSKTNIASLS